MIFVCDCILQLMNTALDKQGQASRLDGYNTSSQTADDSTQEPKFDKWVDSPRAHNRCALTTRSSSEQKRTCAEFYAFLSNPSKFLCFATYAQGSLLRSKY